MSARVLILAGGPDPEHEVSLDSANGIARGLANGSRYTPIIHTFDTIDGRELASHDADVIWPALHGRFGEGGAMQRLLEADGRPFVGSGSRASAIAIDKVATKDAARKIIESLGIERVRVSESCVFDASDGSPPMAYPFVVKPIFEGSTIGLFICRDADDWARAHEATASAGREAMAEPFVAGREITVGMIDSGSGLGTLVPIEIVPDSGIYDYEAKYERDDTAYLIDPEIDEETRRDIDRVSVALSERLGIRDLCRADFLLDHEGVAWFLEVNTMPGFTSHSLVPMACGELGMTGLCELLVDRAIERAQTQNTANAEAP